MQNFVTASKVVYDLLIVTIDILIIAVCWEESYKSYKLVFVCSPQTDFFMLALGLLINTADDGGRGASDGVMKVEKWQTRC